MRRFAIMAGLFVLLVGAGLGFLKTFGQDVKTEPNFGSVKTEAIKVAKPVDLSGKWESVESKVGTKFVTEVKNNTVYVQMYVNDGFSGLWYGTFDILQPGQKTITSKAVEDPDHFALSSAETKDFLYQDESLIFSYEVMGTRTTVQMKRV